MDYDAQIATLTAKMQKHLDDAEAVNKEIDKVRFLKTNEHLLSETAKLTLQAEVAIVDMGEDHA